MITLARLTPDAFALVAIGAFFVLALVGAIIAEFGEPD